jgi:hypothetical protein
VPRIDARQASHWSGRQRNERTLARASATRPPPSAVRWRLSLAPALRSSANDKPMTTAGWVFMTASILSVLTLVSWCYWQILRQRDGAE